MSDSELLSCYEAILSGSSKMLALAKAGEWDKLVEAEQERIQLLEKLKTYQPKALLDAYSEAKRSELIQLILSTDEETQRLSLIWMEELEGLIGSLSVEKKLNQAYDSR